MITDDQLSQWLRSSVPAAAQRTPSRDLWPVVVQRAGTRERLSTADLSIAAIVVIALVMFPKWFWFLAYNL
jgi:hypothetical protein